MSQDYLYVESWADKRVGGIYKGKQMEKVL